MGVSTYDAVALILTNKFHLGKFKFVRIATDVVCVVLGVSLYVMSQGTEGLGTLSKLNRRPVKADGARENT